MKIEIQKDKKGKFYFRILHANGALAMQSGGYARKRNLAEAIATLKAGLPDAKVVDLV